MARQQSNRPTPSYPVVECDTTYNVFVSNSAIYVEGEYTGERRVEVMLLETTQNEHPNPVPYPVQQLGGRSTIVVRNPQSGNPSHYRERNIAGAYFSMTGVNVEEYFDGQRRGNKNKYFIYIDKDGEFHLIDRK